MYQRTNQSYAFGHLFNKSPTIRASNNQVLVCKQLLIRNGSN